MNAHSYAVTHVPNSLEVALNEIVVGSFDKAYIALEETLEHDYEDPIVILLMKCVSYWKERFENIETIDNVVEKADFLLNEWKRFEDFLHSIEFSQERDEQYIHSIRVYVHSVSLDMLQSAHNNPLHNESNVYLQCARCHKTLGNYDQAVNHYQRAVRTSQRNATAMAELGDSLLLIGNATAGKLLLREAFYVAPREIVLDNLDSPLMRKLIMRVTKEIPNSLQLIHQWIAVYAVIWNYFDVKREITTAEFGHLRQRIYALEREHGESPSASTELELVISYFHLIDYYTKIGDNKDRIQQLYLKLRTMNMQLFNQYIDMEQQR